MSLSLRILSAACLLNILFLWNLTVAKQNYNWNQGLADQEQGSGSYKPSNEGYGNIWSQPNNFRNPLPNTRNPNGYNYNPNQNTFNYNPNPNPRLGSPVDQESDRGYEGGSGTSPSIETGSGSLSPYPRYSDNEIGSGSQPPQQPIVPITSAPLTVAPIPQVPTLPQVATMRPPVDDSDRNNMFEGSGRLPFIPSETGSGANPLPPQFPNGQRYPPPNRPNPGGSNIPNRPGSFEEPNYSKPNERIIEFVLVDWQYSEFMAQADRNHAEWKNLERILTTNFRNVLPNGKNYKIELLSLRPGRMNGQVIGEVRLAQLNSNTFDKNILVSLVKIANTGNFGALKIVPQQFDLLSKACLPHEVRCSSAECRIGKYCDGIMDCSMNNRQDEPLTCPKCFGYSVQILQKSIDVQEGAAFKLTCTAPFSCGPLMWEHKRENSQRFQRLRHTAVPTLSVLTIEGASVSNSGIYKCGVGVKNTTVVVKVRSGPRLEIHPNVTRFSLIPGTQPTFWCNSSSGTSSTWILPNNTQHVAMQQISDNAALLNFTRISMSSAGEYFCQMSQGEEFKNISLEVFSPCQGANQFLCNDGLKCYTKKQSCDTIRHCRDASDERNCSLCPTNSLMVDKAKVEVNEGDSDMVKCIGPSACLPIKWERVGFTGLPDTVNKLDNDLYFPMMNSSIAGTYRCSSGSTFAETNVIVHTEPALSLVPTISQMNLIYGENKQVLCRSEPGYRAQWMFQNGKFWPRGVQRVVQPNNGQQLVFTDASRDMTGSYECQLRWGIGYSKKVSISLSVSVNPVQCNSSAGERSCSDQKRCLQSRQFCDGVPQCHDKSDENSCPKCHNGFVAVDPVRLEIEEGSNGHASCWAPDSCQPISWRRHNSTLPLSKRFKPSESKIYLMQATTEDSGQYECFSGDKFAVLNVTVHTAIQLTLSVPAGVQMFNYGLASSVSCSSNVGQPRWRRSDGSGLTSGGYIAESNRSVGSTDLLFNYPMFEASGFYECYVKLRKDTPETSIQLMVYVQPVQCNPISEKRCEDRTRCVKVQQWCDGKSDCADGSDEAKCNKCKGPLYVLPSKISMIEGSLKVFNCQVRSEQCLPVSWHREDGKPFDSNRWINNGQSLILVSSLKEDSGKIICRHGNQSAASNLVVQKVELKLNISGSELRIPSGSTTTVSCLSTTGSPLWSSPTDRHVYMYGVRYRQPRKRRMDISFVNVHKLASGYYSCSLRTRHGALKTMGFKLIVT